MTRLKATLALLGALLCAAATLAPAAQGAFGLKDADVTFTDAAGAASLQAGSHPFAFTTDLSVNSETLPKLGKVTAGGQPHDLKIELPPGLVGSPTATARCSAVDFATPVTVLSGLILPDCSANSTIGLIAVHAVAQLNAPQEVFVGVPVYNLEPPPGVTARFGFYVIGEAPVTFDAKLKETPPYNIQVKVPSLPQLVRVFDTNTVIWGNPSAVSHDEDRGVCGAFFELVGVVRAEPGGSCPTTNVNRPFLTLPRACTGPLASSFSLDSWQSPGAFTEPLIALTHDDSVPPLPTGMEGCEKLGFAPVLAAQPTAKAASSPSGLDVKLDIEDQGLTNPDGLANSDVKRAELTLPEGVTLNPSQAEGLGVCSEADLARESATSAFGVGCPAESKIGTVEVETPLLEGTIFKGSLFVAKPYENPFGSLIALYMTIKEPKLGVGIKLAGEVSPDPVTGQLVATFGEPGHELPQLPFSHFRLHFREGGRSPLITPPGCGSYEAVARLTPWANPTSVYTSISSFEVTSGPGEGPCPPGGVLPFHPRFEAGSLNNNAGAHSPFLMRLQRQDGEQDMTKFSAVLPPGEVGSLVGVAKCPDSAVAAAKAKQGREELADPSCPADSEIGETLAGAGVGSVLTYVGGKIYLAGPYKGDPLSVIAITPAVAGPFDAGTVVVRLALTLNPKTAEVEVDGAASDPIPHILKGIVLKVRDLRVNVDRPDFLLNPTSCDESSARATLFGSYLNVLDPADDVPVDLSTRFQAASCLNLGLKPRLKLNLKGGTKRGGHPGLRAIYTPRKGDANLKGLVTRLPRSAFLDQAHIRTICTRVQFAANACPKGAQYGYIKAWTPLLEEPLQGPAYLRSSNHKLPDLVFDLHGLVDVEVVTRLDSVRGGIRATVEDAPDAPLSKVVLRMQGGKKGLIVNSRHLCFKPKRNRANVGFTGHNGKRLTRRPLMRALGCKGKRKAKRSAHRRVGAG